MEFKSFFSRLLIAFAFAIAALMLMPTMQVSANDSVIPLHYQDQSAVASVGASAAQVTPSLSSVVTETIKTGFGNDAYIKVSVGKLLICSVGGYKDRPGWQYRNQI